MDQFSNLIIRNAYIPVLITASYALLVRKQLTPNLRIFSWFIFLSAIVQVTSTLLWVQSKNNLPLLHFYVATGFLCLAWFYGTVLRDFINKKVIWYIAGFFTIFTLINGIFIQGIFTFASYALTAESILIIILSLSTFMLLLSDIVKEKRMQESVSLNWINSGLFVYYSSSLLIFYFGEVITHTFSKTLNHYTWVLHFVFLTVMHGCFFIGLWKRPRN